MVFQSADDTLNGVVGMTAACVPAVGVMMLVAALNGACYRIVAVGKLMDKGYLKP